MGIPVLETQNAGTRIILVKVSEILLADDGGLDIQYSNEATVDDAQHGYPLDSLPNSYDHLQ